MAPRLAPPLEAVRWFNTKAPITLDALEGRVVVIEAFQMLCPGCVSHGLPQARRVADTFAPADVAVIGLHSVFEHHAAQGPEALEPFLRAQRGSDQCHPYDGGERRTGQRHQQLPGHGYGSEPVTCFCGDS